MQASPAEHRSYLWAVQGKRIAVDLPLHTVDLLRDVIAEGLETDGRGIEVGGLLLGRTRRSGGQIVVEIEDFEPIECEHLAGPSLMLSAADRHSLEARLRKRRPGGISITGFFRSNTRKETGATIEDVALMSTYFSDPSNVFLLVQADRNFPPTAGFLIWEGRSIRSPRPYLEFPFSADDLAGYAHAIHLPAPMVEMPVAPTRPPRKSPSVHLPSPAALLKFVPPNARLLAGWVAAAAVVMAVSAGVMYDESRKPSAVNRPAVAAANSKPAVPVKPTEPPPAPASDPATAEAAVTPDSTPRVAEPETQVPHPAPPVDVPGLPNRPALQPEVRVTPPAGAPATPAVLRPEAAKPVAVASAGAADRRIAPGPPARAPFVVPAMPSAARTADLVDPPQVDARPVPGADAVASLHDLALAPPAAPSRTAAPTFVSVAADPLVGRRGRNAKVVPPAALRPALPDVPADVRTRLRSPVLINVKVYVDRSGKVEFAELLSDGTGPNRDLASMAVFSSRRWQFSPASVDGSPAPSEVVLRYRFGPETR